MAGVAAEHGIPFVVITAGTRNHFALDLGLDRADPVACLGALSDGVELRVDLGVISGQTFVNNVSFGAYAEVVQTPAYRDDKLRHDPGHAARAAAGAARRHGCPPSAGRRADRRAAGAPGGEQPLRDRGHRGPGPSRAARPR